MVNTKQKILEFLKKVDWSSTTKDIAAEVKVSWNTAQVHHLKMVHEGILRYKKVGRQNKKPNHSRATGYVPNGNNQFWLNKGYEKYFKGDKI